MNTAEAIKAAKELADEAEGNGNDIGWIKPRLDAILSALSASAEQQPVAWMFQHGETGRIVFADEWQVMHGFEEANKHLTKIGPLYSAPQASQPIKCKTCNGNDADVPCAYPSKGVQGCLRDKRLQASQPVALEDADINQITLERIGKWPSFEAQSWACKVVHEVLSATSQPSAWDQAIEADLRKEITDKVWAEYSIARQKDATLASISAHQLRTAIRLTLDGAIRALRQQAPAVQEAELWNLRDAIMDALFRKAAPHVWESLVSEAAFQFITKRREYLTTAPAQTGEKTK